MAELTLDTAKSALGYFRVKTEESSSEMSRRSRINAIAALERMTEGKNIDFDEFSPEFLKKWVRWLFSKGYSLSTVKLYLRNVSALYGKAVKDGIASESRAFSEIKCRLESIDEVSWNVYADSECAAKLRSLLHKDFSQWPRRQLGKDLVMMSVLTGGLSFENLAALKKDFYDGEDTNILDIVKRYSKPKNKYLFPLSQPDKTKKQLSEGVGSLFRETLRAAQIEEQADPADLWGALAISSGISPQDIAECLEGRTDARSMFSLFEPKNPDPVKKQEIIESVAGMFVEDGFSWYAMQFRPRVSYNMVKTRMEMAGVKLQSSFYPMEEIVRRIGKKIVSASKPVVPGLLFFQSRAAELPALFYTIGDLAWGYRRSRRPESAYAVISPKAIETYQKTIGQFTPDMDVVPGGSIELKPGDRVEIIGGEFAGKGAEIEKRVFKEEENADSEPHRIVYRLKMIGDNDIEWVVDLDSRLMKREKTLPAYSVD